VTGYGGSTPADTYRSMSLYGGASTSPLGDPAAAAAAAAAAVQTGSFSALLHHSSPAAAHYDAEHIDAAAATSPLTYYYNGASCDAQAATCWSGAASDIVTLINAFLPAAAGTPDPRPLPPPVSYSPAGELASFAINPFIHYGVH